MGRRGGAGKIASGPFFFFFGWRSDTFSILYQAMTMQQNPRAQSGPHPPLQCFLIASQPRFPSHWTDFGSVDVWSGSSCAQRLGRVTSSLPNSALGGWGGELAGTQAAEMPQLAVVPGTASLSLH